jgi:inorganic triphosphatase YgiF
MAAEIELKLALPEQAQRLFLRHPLLRQAARRSAQRLLNVYYDTPQLELRERGIALRLRRKGGRWLQTVKCAGDEAGGIAMRPEWEAPYAGHFDFSAIEDEQVRAWLERPKIAARLAPVFETHFQRIAWLFMQADGARIELALDRGWIAAAGSQAPISEVELELLDGAPDALFALALALAERAPLIPAPLSKADRGYALFLKTPPAPARAAPVALSAAMSPLAAFRAIALACLDQLQRNHAPALTSEDAEYIHQMRVALRRLRAAVRLFRPLLPEDFASQAVALVRELMAPLGQARDYDVLLAEIAQPVLAALPDEPRLAALIGALTARRAAVRRHVLDGLITPRYGQIALTLLARVHALDETATPAAPASSLPAFARQRLRRLRKKTLALARAADAAQPASLHALRIGIKRLRYALDFFAPIAGKKRTRRLLEQLAALQDVLGQINDLANAGALLMDCAGHDAALREAVSLIAGWHGPRYQKLLAAIPPGIAKLGSLPLPRLAKCHHSVMAAPYPDEPVAEKAETI